MARLGHSVWAGVRDDKSFAAIQKLNVQGLKPVLLDVTEQKSVDAAMGEIRKTAGMLNGLVNNAGIVVAGPIEGVRLEELRRQFEVNVIGQVRLIQAALPLLRQCKGRIVNVSSISGRVASPFLGPYAASKFALEAISDSLRRELRRQGISVSIIEPGPIATPIWGKSKTVAEQEKFSPEIEEIYGKSIKKFHERIDKIEREASPVSVVTKAFEHALLSARPRTRYPVGRGMKLFAHLANALPDRWMDEIIVRR